MKEILIEEILRIHEIMGLNKENLYEDVAGPTPTWIWDLIPEMMTKLFGSSEDDYLQKSTDLFNNYREYIRNYNSSPDKARMTDPSTWLDGKLKEDSKLKEAYEKLVRINDELNTNPSELAELIKSSINKTDRGNVDDFLQKIFTDVKFKKIAVDSFFDVNPNANKWKSSWNNNKLRDFDSVEQVNAWKLKLDGAIDQQTEIPGYIKDYLKKDLEDVAKKLNRQLQSYLTEIQSPEIINLLKKYKFNYNTSVKWWNPFKNPSSVKWDKNINQKIDTPIKSVLKDIYEFKGSMDYKDAVDTAFAITKKGANILSSEDSLPLLNKLYKLYIADSNSFNNAWKEYAKENVKYKGRDTLPFELTRCIDGLTWPKDITGDVKVEGFTGILSKLMIDVVNRVTPEYKVIKCGLIPLAFASFIFYLTTGITLKRQVEEVPEISIVKPIAQWLVGYKTKTDLKNQVSKLFPDVSNLIFTENYSLDQMKNKLKQVFKDNKDKQSEIDKLTEVDNYSGVILKNGETRYWIYCTDYDKNYSDQLSWKYMNEVTGEIGDLYDLNDDVQIKRLNKFVGFLMKTFGENFKYSDKEVVTTINNDKFFYKRNNIVIDVYRQDSNDDNNFLSVSPNESLFLKYLTDGKIKLDSNVVSKLNKDYGQGFTEDSQFWKGKNDKIGLQSDNKDYYVKKDKLNYFVKKRNNQNYSEKYFYDFEKEIFICVEFNT